MNATISIERSRTGLPCLWESGGGASNTGWARVIANQDGTPKRPLYIRRRGPLSNGQHALFVVREGDVIIEADHHRRDFRVEVARIVKVGEEEATLEPIATFDEGEWDRDLPKELEAAVEAAKEKAVCYHCRDPHFFEEKDNDRHS